MKPVTIVAALALIRALEMPAAAQTDPGGPPAQPVPAAVLPGTPASAFATLQGRATHATGVGLAQTAVRLRDVRSGRAVAMQRTDPSGAFVFRMVDPGSYIIELLGRDQSIRAASALATVDAGETLSVVLRLPRPIETFTRAVAEHAPQAAAVVAAAAAAGVLAVQSTTDVSPR